ncbi:MAG: lactoylglutathione lyase [Bdellovibrionales bacterium]|jgi:lactoylglutathione lyase|nr:lactoylglutathione lyase [Bdellovibrionales bacterium]
MAEQMRYLHTMIRVGNLEESIRFYRDVLGMKVISHDEYPEGKFTLVFLSYGTTKQDPCIELTYNWDRDGYSLGDGFGHIALGTGDIYAACEKIRSAGGKIVREPGPMKHGATVIAFVEDPNGYKIELIESKS